MTFVTSGPDALDRDGSRRSTNGETVSVARAIGERVRDAGAAPSEPERPGNRVQRGSVE